ncbi:TetR/AcrR family transcriptional regulator [Parvularcula sp. LCG005]|uniref:TetR/AcrR family transcriptional regulator n=1 Tax=Parvularcula sp. LCG005 TaxID=3078805 RepID=UPI002942F2AB|nr:TetR/AcrR family transcriptional regulator [Parvularcula sp. LCG005]WOI52505.1 TetR/AcrR family transcriptional regulator [Parvularcula sp. LCG005]
MGISDWTTREACSRQDQVLQAAARCFVEEGFHGASMSRIAKAAKMSPGHIYHYFESKEEIIKAIVQRDEEGACDFLERFRSYGPDELADQLVGCVIDGVKGNTDAFHSLLTLEILAEAARNPSVREIVADVDRKFRRGMADMLEDRLGLEDALMRVEAVSALFSGLTIRAIRNPDLDLERLTSQIQKALRALLEP